MFDLLIGSTDGDLWTHALSKPTKKPPVFMQAAFDMVAVGVIRPH